MHRAREYECPRSVAAILSLRRRNRGDKNGKCAAKPIDQNFPSLSPWGMNDDVFLVDLTRDVEAATKVTRAPAKQGRLISLSQAGPYLVARRFGRHDLVLGLRVARSVLAHSRRRLSSTRGSPDDLFTLSRIGVSARSIPGSRENPKILGIDDAEVV